MKQRCVPNTISKRFRRKLRRAKSPFHLWLRCKRPAVWARLTRLWSWQFLEVITNIDPYKMPIFASAPKFNPEDWRLD